MNEPVIKPNGRGVSTQSTSTLKDLVFDPETGDFVQVERGSANEGDTVTELSKDGYASPLKSPLKNNNDNSLSGTSINGVPILKDLVFNPETEEFEVVERKDLSDGDTICITLTDCFG